MPENEDAERVYLAVQDQYIMGPRGPVSIDQSSIHAAMELYQVEYRIDCFERVVKVGRHFIKEMYEQAEQNK